METDVKVLVIILVVALIAWFILTRLVEDTTIRLVLGIIVAVILLSKLVGFW